MLVCHCFVVNHERIIEAIAGGATCPDQVGEDCQAGTRCGGCRTRIERLLVVHTPSRALAA